MNPLPTDCGSPANREVLLDRDIYYVCRRCTACCKWPGDVRVEEEELPAMAEFLGLPPAEFIARYTRLRANRRGLSLMEKDNHECVMLAGTECRIHPVKPLQCQGFPNRWRFPGWRELCEAEAVPIAEARARGLGG
jgi:hypothetical protein